MYDDHFGKAGYDQQPTFFPFPFYGQHRLPAADERLLLPLVHSILMQRHHHHHQQQQLQLQAAAADRQCGTSVTDYFPVTVEDVSYS